MTDHTLVQLWSFWVWMWLPGKFNVVTDTWYSCIPWFTTGACGQLRCTNNMHRECEAHG